MITGFCSNLCDIHNFTDLTTCQPVFLRGNNGSLISEGDTFPSEISQKSKL